MSVLSEAPATAGIPTVRNVDHFAYTVPDLEQAVDFFTRVLGAELLYLLGPVEEQDSDWMERQLGVHPRASTQIAMLRLGPVSNLELFQYTAPMQRTGAPGLVDVGGHHLGIAVGDLDRAVAHLHQEPGVRVLGEPQSRPESPAANGRWIQALTPWGMRLELREAGAVAPEELEGLEELEEPEGRQGQTGGPREYRPDPEWNGPGLPTGLGVDHVGYTVEDLDEAVGYFTGTLGGELVHRGARAVTRDRAARQYGVDQPFRIETAVIRLGPVTNVELSACAAEERRTDRPRNSDVGGHHLAFFVEDVEAAAAWLAGRPDTEVLGTPQLIEDGGPIHGDRWVYFRGAGGFQLEVLNMPAGMPYELHTPARRFGPSPKWTNR